MGDTTSLGPRYPTIDYANGGIINTITNHLASTNGQTKYCPDMELSPPAPKSSVIATR
jgi:hypothetical protein